MTLPNVSSELLRTFVSVVESDGFLRAAERLHKTQSTVSQQVRKLEDELGTALFQPVRRFSVMRGACWNYRMQPWRPSATLILVASYAWA